MKRILAAAVTCLAISAIPFAASAGGGRGGGGGGHSSGGHAGGGGGGAHYSGGGGHSAAMVNSNPGGAGGGAHVSHINSANLGATHVNTSHINTSNFGTLHSGSGSLGAYGHTGSTGFTGGTAFSPYVGHYGGTGHTGPIGGTGHTGIGTGQIGTLGGTGNASALLGGTGRTGSLAGGITGHTGTGHTGTGVLGPGHTGTLPGLGAGGVGVTGAGLGRGPTTIVDRWPRGVNNAAWGFGAGRYNGWGRGWAGNNYGYWGNRYGYRSGFYGPWYNGSWAGWGGAWGMYRPWGWGFGPYGYYAGYGSGLLTAGLLTAMSPYNWGYYSYSNPYWNSSYGTPYINYGVPLVSSGTLDPNQFGQVVDPNAINNPNLIQPTPGQQPALDLFTTARQQFMQGDYASALNTINQAIEITPSDPVMHEFRALTLFAMGNYPQAAAAEYAVLTSGPGWNWTTVAGLYPDVAVYTEQLRALESYSSANPNSAEADFLLAYHYLLTGHNDDAAKELQGVLKLQPSNQLAAQLLQGLNGTGQDVPPPPPGAGQAADPTAVTGNWNAKRPDGAAFGLKLGADKQFTWTFTLNGKQQQLRGTYQLENDTLVLQADDKNVLAAQIAMDGNKMNFKLVGDNAADPGLAFTRS